MNRYSSKIYKKKKSHKRKSMRRRDKSKKDDFGIKSNIRNVGQAFYDVALDTVKNPRAAAKNVMGPVGQFFINPTTEVLAKGGAGWVAREGAEYLPAAGGALAGVGLGGAALLAAPVIGVGAGTAALLGGIAGARMGKGVAKQYVDTFKKWGDEKVNELREGTNNWLEKIPFTLQNQARHNIAKNVDEKKYQTLRKHFFLIRDTQNKLSEYTEKFIKDCKQLYTLLQKFGIVDNFLQQFIFIISKEINRIDNQIKDSINELKKGVVPQLINAGALRDFKTPTLFQTPVLLQQLRKSPIKPVDFEKMIEAERKIQMNRAKLSEVVQMISAPGKAQARSKKVVQMIPSWFIDKEKKGKEIEEKLTLMATPLLKGKNKFLINRYYKKNKEHIVKSLSTIKRNILASTTKDQFLKNVEEYNKFNVKFEGIRNNLIATLNSNRDKNKKLKIPPETYNKMRSLLGLRLDVVNDMEFNDYSEDIEFGLEFTDLTEFKTYLDDLAVIQEPVFRLDRRNEYLLDNRNFINPPMNWENKDDIKALAIQVRYKNQPQVINRIDHLPQVQPQVLVNENDDVQDIFNL